MASEHEGRLNSRCPRRSANAPLSASQEFEQLYRCWRGVVRAAARSVLDCDSAADDVTQTIFLRLWRRGPDSWPRRNPRSYFNTAARNEAISFQRHVATATTAIGPLEGVVPSLMCSPEDHLDRNERRVRLAEAIATLPARCQEVMSLVAFSGCTSDEIARELGVTRKAVEKQRSRGRRLLTEKLVTSEVDCFMRPNLETGGGRRRSCVFMYDRTKRFRYDD